MTVFFYSSEHDASDIDQLRNLPFCSKDIKVLKEIPGENGVMFYFGMFNRNDIIYVHNLWALIAYSRTPETLLELKLAFDYEGIEVRVISDSVSSRDGTSDSYWRLEIARIGALRARIDRFLSIATLTGRAS